MIKTKIVETTEKYDKDGKLVEKITREETKCFQIFFKKFLPPYQELKNKNQSVIGFFTDFIRN